MVTPIDIFPLTSQEIKNVSSEAKILQDNVFAKLLVLFSLIIFFKVIFETSKKVYILRPAVVVGPELKGNLKTLVNYVNFRLPWFFNSFNNSMTILDLRNLSFIIKQILSEENKIPPDIYQIGNYQPIEVKNLIKSMQLKRRSKSCLLSIPKNFIYLIFKIGNVLNLPFLNLKTLDKLVLDSQVSTKKISKYIPELPFNNDETINKFL